MATLSAPTEKQVTARAALSTAVAWPIAASDAPSNKRAAGPASSELSCACISIARGVRFYRNINALAKEALGMNGHRDVTRRGLIGLVGYFAAAGLTRLAFRS